ncbi:MAG: NAD(+) diphosphatase [Thermoanaerobaculia bacterium]
MALKGLGQYERPKGFIRLSNANDDLWVSDHYRMRDFQCRLDGTTKYLLVRTDALVKLEILQHELRTRHGLKFDKFTIMSGYRTPYYNAKIGNDTSYSRHLYGDAMDIYIDQNRDGKMDDVNRDGRIDTSDARFLLRIAEKIDESEEWGWLKGGAGVYRAHAAHGPYIHVDARGYVARWGATEEPPSGTRGSRTMARGRYGVRRQRRRFPTARQDRSVRALAAQVASCQWPVARGGADGDEAPRQPATGNRLLATGYWQPATSAALQSTLPTMFDRAAHERTSPPRENALALVVDGDRFGIDGDRLAVVGGEGEIYLGRLDGAPLFLSEAQTETMLDFRAAAGLLTAEHVELLSYAQGILNWTRRTRFCSTCGNALNVQQGGHVRACAQCAHEIYPRTDPAVMMMVTHRDRLLLAQHKGRASKFWSTLAGFVEPGESLEDAVRRELFEETGLTAKELRYFGSQPWPLPASLMIGFTIETADDAVTIDENELAEARWFAREELDAVTLSSPISLSRWMIESWRNGGPS